MANIEFQLDEEHGFNMQKDAQKAVGHLTVLKIGTGADTPADIEAEMPDTEGTKQAVVGILTSWSWKGGHGDPIIITAQISTQNKQTIKLLLHQKLKNTALEIGFKIWDYDPVNKAWCTALTTAPPASSPPLKGLILKEDKELAIKCDEKGSAVLNPENWKLEISIMPAPEEQHLCYATAEKKNVTKAWGVTVGAKK